MGINMLTPKEGVALYQKVVMEHGTLDKEQSPHEHLTEQDWNENTSAFSSLQGGRNAPTWDYTSHYTVPPTGALVDHKCVCQRDQIVHITGGAWKGHVGTIASLIGYEVGLEEPDDSLHAYHVTLQSGKCDTMRWDRLRSTGQWLKRVPIPRDNGSPSMVGVFQVGSSAYRQVFRESMPRTLTDVAHGISVGLPGVRGSGGIRSFLQRRKGVERVTFDHRLELSALSRTLGAALFQDQMVQLAMDVAGFTAEKADAMRRTFERSAKKASALARVGRLG